MQARLKQVACLIEVATITGLTVNSSRHSRDIDLSNKKESALEAQLGASLTGDQEVADSIPATSSNILSWRLILKYFLQSFSPFHSFNKDTCQFLANEYAQVG